LILGKVIPGDIGYATPNMCESKFSCLWFE